MQERSEQEVKAQLDQLIEADTLRQLLKAVERAVKEYERPGPIDAITLAALTDLCVRFHAFQEEGKCQ